MSQTNTAQQLPPPSKPLFNLSARLTIGSAVCFTEGLAATILAMLPADISFHIGATVLAVVVWLLFWLYRDSKLGADIGDLCFWEMIAQIGQLILFSYSIKFWGFWYLFACISFAKLIRVYIGQKWVTQQYGWGKFGPMTLYFDRRNSVLPRPWPALAKEIIVAVAVAVFASCLVKFLPGWARVALMWFIPVTFEFLIGPIQLRMVRDFSAAMVASNAQEDVKAAEIEQLKKELAAQKKENDTLRQLHALPKKAHTDLIDAYETTKPARQGHLVKIAQNIAAVFSNKRDS